MSNQILQVDENMLETKLDRLVSRKGEELLNAMLDAEADEITGAARYERASGRRAYRAGHYERNLTVKAGTMTLRVPKLKGAVFESAVIERYRRREQSVEEALIDMYLAGVSTRQVDDISRLLWGERMPSQTLSDKLKRVYEDIDQWRNRPLAAHSYPYLFVDGVWHKRTWGGSVENVSVLVAIGVDDTGHREVVGVAEGMKEDKASWEQFVRSMIERGLRGVRLVVGDRCAGLVSTVNSMDAAGRALPAVHGPLHAQRPVQGQPQARGMGRVRPEGRVRHGKPAGRVGEGRTGRHRNGVQGAEGRRLLPQGRHQRDHDLPARRLSRRASAADPHEQHDRTAQPRDPPAHQSGRQLPGRQERAHARLRQDPLRHRQPMERTPLPGHVPARRHHAINRLKLSSRQRAEPLLRKNSGVIHCRSGTGCNGSPPRSRSHRPRRSCHSL